MSRSKSNEPCTCPFVCTYITAQARASAASWVKKGGAGSCNFSTDSSKFPTRKITGAQNFNFAPKFFQNGGFSAPNLVSSEEFFFDKKKIFGQFSDSPKFRGERVAGPCPFRATTLLYHMAFICILGVSVKIIIIIIIATNHRYRCHQQQVVA